MLLQTGANAHLIVVGAHRRHGEWGLQLGPVNHAVLHHAPCAVAVVPYQASWDEALCHGEREAGSAPACTGRGGNLCR